MKCETCHSFLRREPNQREEIVERRYERSALVPGRYHSYRVVTGYHESWQCQRCGGLTSQNAPEDKPYRVED